MADFHVRSDSVDVEQIMAQIRTRIREKRGTDYTEAELQHLASVKLEKFLDSRGVRSTLVEAFRKTRVPSAEPPTYEFTDEALFESPRPWLRRLRRFLAPILRLFMNPARVSTAFRAQKQVNADLHQRFRAREEMDSLYYEVVHNLVVEITRLGIDAQNLKMRVESLASRVDFDERRARSLEGLVQRRGPENPRPADRTPESARRPDSPRPSGPPGEPARPADGPSGGPTPPTGATAGASSGYGGPADEPRERRRRRRRRRRRPGHNLASYGGPPPGQAGPAGMRGEPEGPVETSSSATPEDEGPDDGEDDGGSEDPVP